VGVWVGVCVVPPPPPMESTMCNSALDLSTLIKNRVGPSRMREETGSSDGESARRVS
jgi:hypothetical protein